MSDEAKKIVAALRVVCDDRACEDCPCYDWCNRKTLNCLEDDAADLIEELILANEQKDRELAGMSFLLTSAESAVETYKRERDEYWQYIKNLGCDTCSGDCDMCEIRLDGAWSGWEWSGKKENA